MDEYVSKPLRAKNFYEAVAQGLSRAGMRAGSSSGLRDGPEAEFDRAAALLRVGGDEGLLEEVVSLFLEQVPRLMAEIRESIVSRDATRLEQASHKLKGSAGVFVSNGALRAVEELESMGRDGDLSSSQAL